VFRFGHAACAILNESIVAVAGRWKHMTVSFALCAVHPSDVSMFVSWIVHIA
jgi:hypothetical protein